MAAAAAPFVSTLPLGALVQSFTVDGTNIVLGFPAQDQYAAHNTPYFGETIGRVANRIAGARIGRLDGAPRSLAANSGPNCLHGGAVGWGKRVWSGPAPVPVPAGAGAGAGAPPAAVPGIGPGFAPAAPGAVAYTLVSEHGDEGFPGAVAARVTYTPGVQRRDDGREARVLAVEFEAQLVGGADETVVNMTNHSYFNLSAAATVAGTVVTLATRDHLPVDADAIPSGPPRPFPDFDTSRPFTLGADGPDVDSCFVVAGDAASSPLDTRARPLVRVLSAHHPDTGIHLEVLTTEPAFQFYTGHFIDVPAVDGAPARGPRSGFCCEPGRFINACNVPEWRAMTLLKKGDTYGARIVYKAWAE